jgi:hypothetical protein
LPLFGGKFGQFGGHSGRIMVKIENSEEIRQQIAEYAGRLLGEAAERTIYNIIEELPQGHGSSIAPELVVRKISDTEYEVWASYVWTLLNDGTGIYSEKHRGRGPGGEIIPVKAKALHFHNGILAAALGFPGEDVFLRSVKGITPRFYWDRHFVGSRLQEIMSAVARA